MIFIRTGVQGEKHSKNCRSFCLSHFGQFYITMLESLCYLFTDTLNINAKEKKPLKPTFKTKKQTQQKLIRTVCTGLMYKTFYCKMLRNGFLPNKISQYIVHVISNEHWWTKKNWPIKWTFQMSEPQLNCLLWCDITMMSVASFLLESDFHGWTMGPGVSNGGLGSL